MDITGLILIAIPLIALVTGLVEVVKKTFVIRKRYIPVVSLVLGIILALLLWPLGDLDLYTMIIVGLIAGLAASGAFDAVKAINKGSDAK